MATADERLALTYEPSARDLKRWRTELETADGRASAWPERCLWLLQQLEQQRDAAPVASGQAEGGTA